MSEIESLINLDTIRANLKANNIETSLNDDELNSLIDSEINKIIMITGRDIKPVPREDIDLNFNPRTRQYNLEYYPVSSITSIKLDDEFVAACDYVVDYKNGIIKFLKCLKPCNTFKVEYISQESDLFLKNKIIPLLNSMILYTCNPDKSKDATSVKEGDVSLNYDSTQSDYSKINSQLISLRKHVKTRML